MSMIAQFIDNGLDPEEILKQLIKTTPKIASKVKAALANGYLPDQILGFLQEAKKRKSPEKQKRPSSTPFADPSEKVADEMLYKAQFKPESAQDRAHKRLESILGQAGQFGLETIGGMALGGLAGPALKTALGSAQQMSPMLQRMMGAMSVGENLMQGPSGLNESSQQSNPQIASQAQQPQQQAPDSKSILDQIGITPIVDNLLQAGNGPEQISAAVGVQLQPNQKKWIQQNFPQGLEPLIQDYISKAGAQAQQIQQEQIQPQPQQGIVPQAEAQLPIQKRSITEIINGSQDLYQKWKQSKEKNPSFAHSFETVLKTNLGLTDEEAQSIASNFIQNKELQQPAAKIPDEIEEQEPTKIEKGSLTLLPGGDVGTVKSFNEKKSLIEVDGKTKQYSNDDVITSPIPEKDIADIYDELIAAIPEDERSAMINSVGYDPNVNELVFKPHDGAFYVYRDIPPEFAEKIQHALFKAKTTGSNFYGAWAEGEASRGAGLSSLIKELQKIYGGKGKEYVRKYETVFDMFARPKQAVKERAKQEALKRRQAKKKK